MAEKKKVHSRNCKFSCPNPQCDRGMTIKGMDHAAWHWDESRQESTQRFYVTCPCAKKVMSITNTAEGSDKRRAGAKNLSIRSITRLLEPSQLQILEA